MLPGRRTTWQRSLPIWQSRWMEHSERIDLENTLAGIGPRLHALRQQRGVTLKDLSTASDISVSTLSRLESGQRRPNLEQVLALARAYRVQVDELIGAPLTGDPRVHLRPITRN